MGSERGIYPSNRTVSISIRSEPYLFLGTITFYLLPSYFICYHHILFVTITLYLLPSHYICYHHILFLPLSPPFGRGDGGGESSLTVGLCSLAPAAPDKLHPLRLMCAYIPMVRMSLVCGTQAWSFCKGPDILDCGSGQRWNDMWSKLGPPPYCVVGSAGQVTDPHPPHR